jgi:hypothetical protein
MVFSHAVTARSSATVLGLKEDHLQWLLMLAYGSTQGMMMTRTRRNTKPKCLSCEPLNTTTVNTGYSVAKEKKRYTVSSETKLSSVVFIKKAS